MIKEDQGYVHAVHLFSHGHQFHGAQRTEYENLLSSLSLQEEAASAPQAHDMSRGHEDASTSSEVQ